jgi:hypothetical protein
MTRWSLAVLLAAATAFADDRCLERCGSKLADCSARCGDSLKCAEGCGKQYDGCNGKCPSKPTVLRGKGCVGAKGQLVSCEMAAEPAPKQKRAPSDAENQKRIKELTGGKKQP